MSGIPRVLKIILIICACIAGALIAAAYPAYLIGGLLCHGYFDRWGNKLVELEKKGLLSNTYGAGWQDVLAEQAMKEAVAGITNVDSVTRPDNESERVRIVDGIVLDDYPSLSIINKLREVRTYSNTIEIVDRFDRPIATIRTDHYRARINEFPSTLINALIAAEDKNFRKNKYGFEYGSFVRATLRAIIESALSFKKIAPRGTSTITQQVAKLFISRLDEQGFRRVSRSVNRKVRELQIAVALRKMFTADDILEVYCNHCVTSDYGMIGYSDIAEGLFGKKLSELTEAECVYLSRMVKWGRNIPSKIIRQCRIDMPRIGKALGWDQKKQASVLAEISNLSFRKPRRLQGCHNALVDLANEFWLLSLRKLGIPENKIEQMNIIDPNSLIRKKGNLRIKLTIDAVLQKRIEALVNSRGYGPDTTIIDDMRIGSSGETIELQKPPHDTLRLLRILQEPIDFHEPNSAFLTSLNAGDTVYTNIRYTKIGKNKYRRSLFHYVRRPVVVNGQYFAYAAMNSRTGKLLAYYSKDRIGSRLACLLKNRTPNGSSVVKPICNALMFDMGMFSPNTRWTDTLAVEEDVPWKRSFDYDSKGKKTGVVFALSAVRGVGYTVHNHDDIFEGCRYIFELLNTSNNILGAETMYRLNCSLFTPEGEIAPQAFPVVRLFSRINSFQRIRDSLRLSSVTGVRVYKEIARIVGIDVDSIVSYGRRIPLSDSMFSVALGALEMTLYEQLHLFNVLYNNDIIERPAQHPSLVIESIVLNGDTVTFPDTIKRYHPFTDLNSLRTTWLGMHLRLTGNTADGLTAYDIEYPSDTTQSQDIIYSADSFSPDAFTVDEPMSNFAKSGTTDDVIRPFNVDASSKLRTNYGLWNAVLRLDLSKLSGRSIPEITDVTIACIGECNEKFTGPRDGKSLHKFLSIGLLKEAGIKVENGFFSRYERYIRSVPPDMRFCGQHGILENDNIEKNITPFHQNIQSESEETVW